MASEYKPPSDYVNNNSPLEAIDPMMPGIYGLLANIVWRAYMDLFNKDERTNAIAFFTSPCHDTSHRFTFRRILQELNLTGERDRILKQAYKALKESESNNPTHRRAAGQYVFKLYGK